MLTDFTFIDAIGVLGSIIIAGAYLAVSRSWMDATRPAFNLLNLGGATLILISLYDRPNAGAIMMEVLWVAIALYSLIRYLLQRKQQ